MDGATHGHPEVLEPEGLGPLPEVPTYFGSVRSDVCLGLMGGVGHCTPEAMAPVAVAPNSLAATTLHVRPALAIASPCSTTTAAPTTGAPAATTPATVASATAATPTTLTAAPAAALCVGNPEIELGKW